MQTKIFITRLLYLLLLLLFDNKKKETNLLMYLNDIPPQALEIYDFNWFGQAEKFKKRC